MVFRVTKLDYAVTSFIFIAFLWSFFFGSKWGDQHFATMGNDPATITYMNLFVIFGSFILVYEMFQMFVLPGKRQGRELPWKLYFKIFRERIIHELRSGVQEYRDWRKPK